jgi:hypothetical protein
MKNTFKTILLLLVLMSAISACRKDAPAPPQIIIPKTDFRDSLVGNYDCTIHKMHYMAHSGVVTTFDSLQGNAIVTVSKSSASSGMIIDGNQYSLDYQDSSIVRYIIGDFSTPTSAVVYFYLSNPHAYSVSMDTGPCFGCNFFREGDWTEYVGPKMH